MKRDSAARDWVTWVMLGTMGFVLVLAALFSGYVYRSYENAFERALPKTVVERVDANQKPANIDEIRSLARAEWGQLGDYFGGTLNPVFGFVSVIALLFTIVFQARELKASTAELRNSAEALASQNHAILKQSFEQTFFAWLGTYREVLGDVTAGGGRGKAALQKIWKDSLTEDAADYWGGQAGNGPPSLLADALMSLGKSRFGELVHADYPVMSRAALTTWEDLYAREINQVDSLFRVLFRLLRWVDRHEHLTQSEKWEYIAIVRAQLSWIEMVFLFYNGHTSQGARFKDLINRYALFDNLDPTRDPLILAMKENPPDAIGYAASAYSSDEARLPARQK